MALASRDARRDASFIFYVFYFYTVRLEPRFGGRDLANWISHYRPGITDAMPHGGRLAPRDLARPRAWKSWPPACSGKIIKINLKSMIHFKADAD